MPPGYRFEGVRLDNLRAAISDIKGIVGNEELLGVLPYRISVVEGEAEDIEDFFISGPPYWGNGVDRNILYVGGHEPPLAAVEGRTVVEDNNYDLDVKHKSHMLIPSVTLENNNGANSWLFNEMNHFGMLNQPSPGVCSVRDLDTRGPPLAPQYCSNPWTTPNPGDTHKKIDRLFHEFVTGFGGHTGRQLNRSYFNQSDEQILDTLYNPGDTKLRGFNLRIQTD